MICHEIWSDLQDWSSVLNHIFTIFSKSARYQILFSNYYMWNQNLDLIDDSVRWKIIRLDINYLKYDIKIYILE